MKKRQGQKGFTLIELMIVVAVIGVLTAVAVPQYQNYVKKAEIGVGLANISALKINIEDYIATEGDFPTATSSGTVTFARLGTSKDLGSGELTIAKTSGTEGKILYTLDNDSNASGKKVQLERSSAGLWTCKTDAEEALAPAKCTVDTTI